MACYWLDVLDCVESTDMNYPSIKSEIDQAQRSPSIHELAYSEPDVSGIAPHVFAAHQEAKSRLKQHGSATAEITFRPDVGAFELVAENKDVASILRALGPQAKITIHF